MNNIIVKYMCGSFAYGLVRNIVYKSVLEHEKDKQLLYTDRLMKTILNSCIHPYITPYAIYEDVCNLERTIRGLPLPKNNSVMD